MSEYKKGELIVFKTHPYIGEHTNIKITAYSDYTSPILVIKETKEKTFDKTNGKEIGQLLNCLYYNSKDGKFIEKWINSNFIEKISPPINTLKILTELEFEKDLKESEKDSSTKNYENLIRESYLNKKVTLKSVDLELTKIKTNRTKENGDLIETNHLEFLPPIMIIIGFKFTDEKNKFCEKSGTPLIELKCKWYNSNTKTFSELYFPSKTLFLIKETQNLKAENDLLSDITNSINENSFLIFPLSKPFKLENNEKEKSIIKTLGHSESIIFKHYFYQMNYFDYITQNKSTITIDTNFQKKTENEITGTKYPSYNNGYKLKISDCKFKIDNYYSIIYVDTFNNKTRRIIKVKDLIIYIKDFKKFKEKYESLKSWEPEKKPSFVNYNYHQDGEIFIHLNNEEISGNTLPKSIFEDKNIEIIINTNCLLRRGKIRNFKLNQISEIREIIDGESLFEN